MLITELDYFFPPELIAQVPSQPCRVALVSADGQPRELTLNELLGQQFRRGDLLVVNETKVIPARVFANNEVEVLFLKARANDQWEVLFPAREYRPGDTLELPQNLTMTLKEKGLPQIVSLSRPIDASYFAAHGEMALPPYIQEARAQRHNRVEDRSWYQTQWAQTPGSVAAPTASLHFQQKDFEQLERQGVDLAKVTLHVGAGTFFPIKTQKLEEHRMHSEWADLPVATIHKIQQCKTCGGRVWALGTTVTRTLESWAAGLLEQQSDGGFQGETRLFIYPPFEFKIVDHLMTNFHQPRSTLLSLVAAFAGLETTRKVYQWAVERRFQLFSYGDLSVWLKP
jgi:S-adenosylmethionine:tRNA ribosyltransferase-isomerase